MDNFYFKQKNQVLAFLQMETRSFFNYQFINQPLFNQ